MERTPKFKRKSTLSLGSRLNKRHSGEHRILTSQKAFENHAVVLDELQRSPVEVIDSNDSTPPHKKPNLNDSIDFSPNQFNSSCSPSAFLSQSLAIESPEVGWTWGMGNERDRTSVAVTIPSSNTNITGVDTRGRLLHREEQRKAMEMQMHRAEKSRATAELKKRCARLQEQLKEVETQKAAEKENKNVFPSTQLHKEIDSAPSTSNSKPRNVNTCKKPTSNNITIMPTKNSTIITPTVSNTIITPTKNHTKVTPTTNNTTINDFFNDTESDDLLLEATQHIEAKIVELTQNPTQIIDPEPSTPLSSKKEKRSSLYLQFLEDDCPDDWFISLEEASIQTTPRSSFQRYNSMPTESSASAIKRTASKTTKPTTASSSPDKETNFDISECISKIKRHGSTYSLGPSSSYGRFHMRK